MEALIAADTETEKLATLSDGSAHIPEPLFLAVGRDKTPAELVLWAFEQVPAAQIEETLLSISLNNIPSLLRYIEEWFRKQLSLALTNRVLTFLIRVYYNQLIADQKLKMQLERIRMLQKQELQDYYKILRYNLVGLDFIKNQ